VGRLKQDLRERVAGPGGDVEAMDQLVETAHQLLDAEVAFEDAQHRLANAELESRHAATQRAVVYFAAAPVLVPLVAGALVLFEVLSAVWLLAVIPLFVAGLWIGFAPVRRVGDVIRERTRAAWTGAAAGVLLVLALVPWPSGTASVVLTIAMALAVAGTIALLARESRIP
jgi:hypothetical protein